MPKPKQKCQIINNLRQRPTVTMYPACGDCGHIDVSRVELSAQVARAEARLEAIAEALVCLLAEKEE